MPTLMRFRIGLNHAVLISLLATFFIIPFSIAGLEVFSITTIFLWSCRKIKNREFSNTINPVLILSLLFFICSAVSVAYSGYLSLSLKGLFRTGKYLLLMWITMETFRDESRFRWIIGVGLASLIILLSDCFFQAVSGYDLFSKFPIRYTDEHARLTGSYKSYGLLAAHLIAVLPLLLSIVVSFKEASWRNVKRIAVACIFFLSLYFLYKTHSRAAWGSCWAALVIFSILTKSKKILVILIILALAVPFVLPRNVLIHLSIERQEQSLYERYRLWERALQVIVKKPLFGCGINTFTKNYSKFDEVKNWRVPGYPAHNGYLQLAAETGLISLTLFLLLIFLAIKRVFISSRNETREKHKCLKLGLLAGLFALLMQAGIDTTLHNIQSAALIWFYLGLCLSFRRST